MGKSFHLIRVKWIMRGVQNPFRTVAMISVCAHKIKPGFKERVISEQSGIAVAKEGHWEWRAAQQLDGE